ncbi:recombinase family protein [Streptomyces sp. MMS24-I2-30]|uniref:recombinase family protein n=1 Tax=Streptomyces sp. MMS24-I2-30 TaxID=3351564 RepID=UPI003896D1C8
MTTAAVSLEHPWTQAELTELAHLKTVNEQLPDDSPRALLSVRLSILTDDTTSPVRQELDLWRKANDDRVRVVGVARDLNVSATKVPPWKRKELGNWLNDRSPEFDVLMFWKLDRFVRRILDLQVIINWCQEYEKNLKSLHDPIDLSSTMGKTIISLIAGMAEIEAANTGIRVASVWQYAKTQDTWVIGRPPFGYATEKNKGEKVRLVIDPLGSKVLRWAYGAALRGVSASKTAKILNRAGVPGANGGKWTSTTLLLQLRNPAIKGLRVEVGRRSGRKRSREVLDTKGNPIKVADAILTPDEFDELQATLDRASRTNENPWTSGATKFLGVIICRNCKTNYTVRTSTSRGVRYKYLRCRVCGGKGANPQELYSALVEAVLEELGDHPVEYREYARGAEKREQLRQVEASIKYYMEGLAPGGRFDRGGFVKETAEETLQSLLDQMDEIDPESTKDRWVLTHDGRTYQEQWETGGMEAMSRDLLRAGIKFEVAHNDSNELEADLLIPEDVKERLVIREDAFKTGF